MEHANILQQQVNKTLEAGHPAQAICYLTELLSLQPHHSDTRMALAIALGDAGHPEGALKILRATAENLSHRGFLLPAMVVIRQGLQHAPNDGGLLRTLGSLHVRSARAKAKTLPPPPPLKRRPQAETEHRAEALLTMEQHSLFNHVVTVGCRFPDAGVPVTPTPLPLFCELDTPTFIETVRHLHYKKVSNGINILIEGEVGDTLLVIASGQVTIDKGGKVLATIGAGAVLGEMALITGTPRSATATAAGDVEYFTLSRTDVERLSAAQPQIAQQLIEYCRRRMIANLLRSSPLFKQFDDATRFQLIGQFQRVALPAQTMLITQGDIGKGLYVLATGEVEVRVSQAGEGDHDSVVVANLSVGDVFGEISLLHDQPTTASVQARGNVGVLFLSKEKFQAVLQDHPQVKSFLEGLSSDRLKAANEVNDGTEILDADDLIIL